MGYAIPEADIRHEVVAKAASTNFPSGAAPQVLNGTAIVMNRVRPGTLSARVTVLAQTDSLTISAKWQVSNNNSTWYDCVPSNNAANVALATGTSGTDTAASAVLEANDAVYGYKYARLELYTGVGVATTGDLGGIWYSYRENT